MPRAFILAAAFAAAALIASTTTTRGSPQGAPHIDPALFSSLQWRHIGPFRGGRTTAVAGVPSAPHVLYIGGSGGVWKTTDAGRTWSSIFDGQPTASIGAIAVSPADPNTLYAGTGEGESMGSGLYTSIDAGRTWTRLGLAEAPQIARIAIDVRTPTRIFVAAPGNPYGPGGDRGVFRSTDAGKSFQRMLHPDENTGASDVLIDPANGDVIYAALWESRQAPWEGEVFTGAATGLHKSTDGGATWRRVGTGLPDAAASGRIRLAIVPVTSSSSGPPGARLVALIDTPDGVMPYRSDDGGETFSAAPEDPAADGRWVHPADPDVVVLPTARGALVSVNGGRTWSSRFTQPTASIARVTADNAFPYRVCGALRADETGCAASRGDHGELTARDWSPLGAEDAGMAAPDPSDPDVVYLGRVARVDRRTQQRQPVGPALGAGARIARDAPLLFSPADNKTLFFAAHSLWKTANGGQVWTEISGDLSREPSEAPPGVPFSRVLEAARPVPRGAISAVAPSHVDARTIWAGTEDGLIHVTRDGGATWANVTPPGLGAWARVTTIEASHFDPNIAYAVSNSLRLNDFQPHAYRTRDGGATWVPIVRGLPAATPVNTLREDIQRRGLLFAGSDTSVSVSFDDGDNWQGLRLNMPPAPIRDLAIKHADVIAGTDGRGIWILDDISPLRELTPDVARAVAFLFRPAVTWRTRVARGITAPLPAGEPTASNPPDGVAISYNIGGPPTPTAVSATLEIIDSTSGDTIRRFTSDASAGADRLPSAPGLHRVVWDVRYSAPLPARPGAPAETPQGMFVQPGTYQVRLTVDGRVMRQPVVVRMDPRVRTPPADLALQFTLSRSVDRLLRQLGTARAEATSRNEAAAVARLDAAIAPLVGLLADLQAADSRPTAAMEAAVAAALQRGTEALAGR